MSVENFDEILLRHVVVTPRAPVAARRGGPVDAIKEAVCANFQIPLIEMISHRRSRCVARPRQIAMYLARELTVLSLPAIGRHFGNRDHTTVMTAIRRVKELATADPDFGARVVEIRQHLLGGVEHGTGMPAIGGL